MRELGETHSIGYPVRESHELDVVPGTFPVRVQGQHQPQRGGMRIGMGVRQRDISEAGQCAAVGPVHGTHIQRRDKAMGIA